jgi:DNA-binding NtrC family response regulator
LFATLHGAGYEVVLAGCGEEALRIGSSTDRAIDALVCDCNLPGADGVITASQFTSLRPSVPCLLISAGSDKFIPPQFVFLSKPFSPHRLRYAIAQILEAGVSRL